MAARRTGTGIRAQREIDRDPRPAAKRAARRDPRRPAQRGLDASSAPARRFGTGRRPRRGPGEGHLTAFDRFAEMVAHVVSSAYFFAACIAMVMAWALFGPPLAFSDTWQLVINTGTTIVTFLMVAVMQNSARRAELAMQGKLDAIADALADFMDKADIELDRDVEELLDAVGLEKRQGSK